jgi:hypothetical protein
VRIALRLSVLLAGRFLAAQCAQADSLLYKPGDVIAVLFSSTDGSNTTVSILAVDPATSQVTPLSTDPLLQPTLNGVGDVPIALDANGDILAMVGTGLFEGRVVRIDARNGLARPVADVFVAPLSTNIDRLGSQLFFAYQTIPAPSKVTPRWGVASFDLETMQSSSISEGGWIGPPNGAGVISSVRIESGTSLLVGEGSLLLRILADTGVQSVVADLPGIGFNDLAITNQGVVALGAGGIFSLGPGESPTLLAAVGPQGNLSLAVLPDGSFAVAADRIYHVEIGSEPTSILDPCPDFPSTPCFSRLGGLVAAPDSVPDPAAGQLVALLALTAIRRRRLRAGCTTPRSPSMLGPASRSAADRAARA